MGMHRLSLKRPLAFTCAVAALLATPATAAAANSHHVLVRGSLAGTVVAINGTSFTVETPGKWAGVVDAMTAAATRITKEDYPYVYGGGHAQASVASVGIPGPGYNGRRKGFDCSGSVAAVLAAGGLWPAQGGVPNDYWVIQELLQQRLIAPGPGAGPVEVTLYDDPGVHIFMSIDGGFFGTSDGGGGGNPRGGAGWLYDGASFAWGSVYRRYHIVPSALAGSRGTSHKVTFQLGGGQDASALQLHEKVRVAYAEAASGSFTATAIG